MPGSMALLDVFQKKFPIEVFYNENEGLLLCVSVKCKGLF